MTKCINRNDCPPEWWASEQEVTKEAYTASVYGQHMMLKMGTKDMAQSISPSGIKPPKPRPKQKKYPQRFADSALQGVRGAMGAYKLPEDRESFDGFEYHPGISTDRVAFWSNRKGDAHIGVRGTDMNLTHGRWTDWTSDLGIALGFQDEMSSFQGAHDKVEEMIKYHKDAYPNGKISMSGHSLGGAMTDYIMEDPEIAKNIHIAHSFNSGSGVREGHPEHPSHLHRHFNKNDPLSMLSSSDTGATEHKHKIKGHSINELNSQYYWDTYTNEPYQPAYRAPRPEQRPEHLSVGDDDPVVDTKENVDTPSEPVQAATTTESTTDSSVGVDTTAATTSSIAHDDAIAAEDEDERGGHTSTTTEIGGSGQDRFSYQESQPSGNA